MSTYDVVVIGAGHNGLICAAYLANSGLRTLVLEARESVGGCASTVEAIGARVNICNCDHLMVRATPIIDELDLANCGLRYLDVDPALLALTWDGDAPWFLFRDPERTVQGLQRAYPRAAAAYRAYLADALPAARLVASLAGARPDLRSVLPKVLAGGSRAARRVARWCRMSALDVLGRYFEDEAVILPALITGPTVWGLDPDQPGTGLAGLGYALRHVLQVGRPVGGSGSLTDAVRSVLEAAGGEVRCRSRVRGLEPRTGGGWRIEVGDEVVVAEAVVGACDPRTIRSDLLGEPGAGPEPDGYESKVDAVLSAPPRYRVLEGVELDGVDPLVPTAVISPTLAELRAACAARTRGEVIERPMLLANVPSALDETMRSPEGGDLLSLEVLWTPYGRVGGWGGDAEPRRWLESYAGLVQPGFLDTVGEWRAMTPPDYEAQFGLRRGYAPSFPGTPLDAVLGRPRPLARYRTEHPGLYLTGAATYPGAGIWGTSGRNAAAVVRADRR